MRTDYEKKSGAPSLGGPGVGKNRPAFIEGYVPKKTMTEEEIEAIRSYPYYNPMVDRFAKKLYLDKGGQTILLRLCKSIMGEKVEILKVESPELLLGESPDLDGHRGEGEKGKQADWHSVRLDCYVKLSSGHSLVVETQRNAFGDLTQRFNFYSSLALERQLKEKRDYREIGPVSVFVITSQPSAGRLFSTRSAEQLAGEGIDPGKPHRYLARIEGQPHITIHNGVVFADEALRRRLVDAEGRPLPGREGIDHLYDTAYGDVHLLFIKGAEIDEKTALDDFLYGYLYLLAKLSKFDPDIPEEIQSKYAEVLDLLRKDKSKLNMTEDDVNAYYREMIEIYTNDQLVETAKELQGKWMEAEDRAEKAEKKVKAAESKAKTAEKKAKAAESKAKTAEKKAKTAEDKAKAAEKRAEKTEELNRKLVEELQKLGISPETIADLSGRPSSE